MPLTQVLNAQNKVHIERESVLQLNCEVQVLGGTAQTGCQSNFRPIGKTGTEPLTPDMADGNNLLALTVATPLEDKPCVVTRKEPPPRTHVSPDDMCSDSSESRKTDALECLWLQPRKVM